jgi:acetamidase/formamidase
LSWGWFPIDKEAVVTAKSGQTIEIYTLTGAGLYQDYHPLEELESMGVPENEVLPDLIEFWQTRKSRPREGRAGHLVTGPIYIDGAEPGDTLEIQVLHVRPRVPWGFNSTRAFSGVMSKTYPGYRDGDKGIDIPPETDDALSEEWRIIRTEHSEDGLVGVYPSGIRVPLAPFMGVMAVAPIPVLGEPGVEVEGVQSSGPPGAFGGNLDVKHLTAGSSLFLPVFHSGARFYVGDPHGAQGDGEVSGLAIEQSMVGVFRFILHKDMETKAPRAETVTHHLIMGIDVDLDRALRKATENVVDFLVDRYEIRPSEAFSIASVAVDFTISEAVDETQIVTAFVPKSIFPRPADDLRH